MRYISKVLDELENWLASAANEDAISRRRAANVNRLRVTPHFLVRPARSGGRARVLTAAEALPHIYIDSSAAVLVHTPGAEIRKDLSRGAAGFRSSLGGLGAHDAVEEHRAFVGLLEGQRWPEVPTIPGCARSSDRRARSERRSLAWVRATLPHLETKSARSPGRRLIGAQDEFRLHAREFRRNIHPLHRLLALNPCTTRFRPHDAARRDPVQLLSGKPQPEAALMLFAFEFRLLIERIRSRSTREEQIHLAAATGWLADANTLLLGVGNRTHPMRRGCSPLGSR